MVDKLPEFIIVNLPKRGVETRLVAQWGSIVTALLTTAQNSPDLQAHVPLQFEVEQFIMRRMTA